MTDQPVIPFSVCMEPREMRAQVERALVNGQLARDTIGQLALRVLEAMREPTSKMIEAGQQAEDDWCDPKSGQPGPAQPWIWRAMIDAAMRE